MIGARWLLVIVGLAGCGAAPQVVAPGPSLEPAPIRPEDLDLTLAPIALQGGVLTRPELGRPPMLLVESRRKATLVARREAYQRARARGRADEHRLLGQVLATELYQAAGREARPDRERALLVEARQIIGEVVTSAGDKVDATILAIAAVHDVIATDWPAARARLAALAALPGAPAWVRGWRAWAELLTEGQAAAVAALAGAVPDRARADEALVLAWVRFASGDRVGAWAAMAVAAAAGRTTRPIEPRHLLWLAGHGGASVADAAAVIQAHVGADAAAAQGLLLELAPAMAAAGRWQAAIDAVEVWRQAAAAGASGPPAALALVQRVAQAEYALRLGVPATVSGLAEQALVGLAACGARCDDDRPDLLARVRKIADFFHRVYVTSGDARYLPAARVLYTGLVGPGPAATDAAAARAQLDESARNLAAGAGTHERSVLEPLVGLHAEEVRACYEAALLTAPALTGVLGLELQVDAAGAVIGAATDPPPGAAGLAAVAACAEAQVRTWVLPARTRPGLTTLRLSVQLAPR